MLYLARITSGTKGTARLQIDEHPLMCHQYFRVNKLQKRHRGNHWFNEDAPTSNCSSVAKMSIKNNPHLGAVIQNNRAIHIRLLSFCGDMRYSYILRIEEHHHN
jgi:hypothetical protein